MLFITLAFWGSTVDLSILLSKTYLVERAFNRHGMAINREYKGVCDEVMLTLMDCRKNLFELQDYLKKFANMDVK